jgi:hypothetical protein
MRHREERRDAAIHFYPAIVEDVLLEQRSDSSRMNSQLLFSDYFKIDVSVQDKYGALNICIDGDLQIINQNVKL